MNRTALIIGATGGIGSEVAKAFLARGWRVRALHRKPKDAARNFAWLGGIDWVQGDALNAADVARAAAGADLLFHGANPPGYQNWEGLAVPMLANSIAAAKASGARLLFPGNIYNFGPDAWPLLSETSPQHPQTRKGAIRVRMETMIRDMTRDGGKALIVRAADFFGPHAPGSWFGGALVKPGKPLRSITYPGPRAVGHAWAYLPDLAETIARLVENEGKLAPFESVHFAGHWFAEGVEMAEAIRRVAGQPALPIRGFPWPLLYLAAPFVRLFRELIEMRYLWRQPLRLDNRKLVALIGAEPHTPLDQALRATLIGLKCLPEPEASFSRTVAA